MWIGISIFGVVVFGLVIWFLSSSRTLEPLDDSRELVVKSRESFEKDCKYLTSVGLLRDLDCINFLCFSDMLARLDHRYYVGFHTGYQPIPKVEASLMSLNMRNLADLFDSDPSEQTLFEVYAKTFRFCMEAKKVETDLKLAKKYKSPYCVNFEGKVYWVLPT